MVNCVKMSIFESFLITFSNFILLNILFHLCVCVKWSLNCSVLSPVQNSVFNCVHVFVLSHSCDQRYWQIMYPKFVNKLYLSSHLFSNRFNFLKMHGQSLCRKLRPVPISNYPLNIVDQFTSNTQDFASTLLENFITAK